MIAASLQTMIISKNRDLDRFCEIFICMNGLLQKKQKITLMKILSEVCEKLDVQYNEILNTMGMAFYVFKTTWRMIDADQFLQVLALNTKLDTKTLSIA